MASPVLQTTRLQEKYFNEVIPLLKEQLNYTSPMQVPRVEKVCLNQGIGQASQDKKIN